MKLASRIVLAIERDNHHRSMHTNQEMIELLTAHAGYASETDD
jgi:hypothetical protein